MEDYIIVLTDAHGQEVVRLKSTTHTGWVHLITLWNEKKLFRGTFLNPGNNTVLAPGLNETELNNYLYGV